MMRLANAILAMFFGLISTLSFSQVALDWAVGSGEASSDIANGITVDGSGNAYVTGSFSGTVDFDPGAGVTNLTSAGSSDIFIQKLDVSGNLVWVYAIGGTSADAGVDIKFDGTGNIYVTGNFYNTVDFDPGAGVANLISAGSQDFFVLKLDLSGNYVWAVNMGGTSIETVTSMDVDASGNVLTTGDFSGMIDLDPGAGTLNYSNSNGPDIFISKIDANGNLVWGERIYNNTTNTLGGGDIAVDASGNVFITSYFTASTYFVGSSTITLTGTSIDMFVQKLNSSGTSQWVKAIGSTNSNYATPDDIATDASGNVYITGSYWGTIDFNPSASVLELTSVSSSYDAFVLKLSSTGLFSWVKSMGDTGEDKGWGIAVSGSEVFVTGYFAGTADFDPLGSGYYLTAAGGADVFVQSISTTGSVFSWAKSFGGASTDRGTAISLDGSNNAYVAGYFGGTADFNPGTGTVNLTSVGGNDIFSLKLKPCDPITVNAGGDQTVCVETAMATMAGNTPALGSGQWTTVSGPGGESIVSPASPTTNITGLVAGIYMFRWTVDDGYCTDFDDVAVTVTSPTTTPLVTDISCYGLTDGMIQPYSSGGTLPLTFSWSNFETTEDIMNLAAGVYTLTITDINTCEFVESYTITESQLPVALNVSITSYNETTADLYGDVPCEGSTAVGEKGIVYDTSPSPTTASNKEIGGAGSGGFTSNLTGLSPGTMYYWRAYAINSNGTSYADYDDYLFTLSTEPTAHVTGFTASNPTYNSIDLNWTQSGSANGYLIIQRENTSTTFIPTDGVQYFLGQAVGDGKIADDLGAVSSTTINSLNALTNYHFTIIPYEWDGSNPETINYYTAATIPTTDATTIDGMPTYCSSVGGGSPSPMRVFTLVDLDGEGTNDIYNTPSNCGVFYTDYTSQSADLRVGSSYTLNLNLTTCGTPSGTYQHRVYIDWNKDGDYDDASEFIMDVDNTSSSTPINVPATASIGVTGMRILADRNGSIASSCENGHNGETQDYTINILPTYCTVTGAAGTNGYLKNVTLNTLFRESTFDGYIAASETTSLLSTDNFTLSVEQNNTTASGGWTAAWVDWNDDADFDDANEEVAAAQKDLTVGTYTRNEPFSIPGGVGAGFYNMRVVWKDGAETAPTNCDSYSNYIDWEEYTIEVTEPCMTISSSVTDNLCYGESAAAIYTSVTNAIPAFNEEQVGFGTLTNSTTTYPAPYGNYYWGAKHQFLIKASEITNVYGDIGSLAFDVVTANGTPLTDFTISMKNSGITTMSAFETTGFTQVYYNASYTEVTGWNTHVFDTPFAWDQASNIVVEICFANGAFTNNAVVNQTNAGFTASIWKNQDSGFSCSDNTSSGTSVNRPNMKLGYGYDYLWSNAENTPDLFGITEGVYTVTIDAGNGCVQPQTVTVIDPDPLTVFTSVTDASCLGFSDGEAGAAVTGGFSPYSFIWNDPDAQITQSATGLYAGSYGVTIQDLNGCLIQDAASVFDPTTMSGTYTVGGAAPDYASIQEAVDDLMCRGVGGAVIIEIRDGVYNEQLNIGSISGVSFSNNIVFYSESYDSTAVTITYGANVADNYTVKFDGASYITFQGMTFEATNTSYGHVFEIEGGASDINIENCEIRGVSTNSTSDDVAVVFSSSNSLESNLSFSQNRVLNGSSGFKIYGEAGLESGLAIQNNKIEGFYAIGVYIQDQISPVIYGNEIKTSSTNNGTVSMVSLTGCVDFIYILYNKIFSSSSDANGIEFTSCISSSGMEGTTGNNMIRVDGKGIVLDGCNYQWLYHNSIEVTNTTNKGIEIFNGGSDIEVVNNISYASGDGYAYYVDASAAGVVTLSDYNDFYSTATYAGHWEGSDVADVTELYSNSGMDFNSSSVDPLYASSSDLHLTFNSPIASLAGTDLTAVIPQDIDGTTRTATPLMGCDELMKYYWVGNSGQWSDYTNHWSTASGGSPDYGTAPTSADFVIFDTNSFSGPGQLLEIDVNGYAKQIDFQDISRTPVFHGSGMLIIGL